MTQLSRSGAAWWIVIVFCCSFFVPSVSGASQSLTLSDAPALLDQNTNTEITVALSCPGCSTDSYLRGVFYASGTSYFGYTQANDGSWTNAPGSSCSLYYKVPQSDLSKEGTWSGVLNVKPDTTSSYYVGPGEYLFKVGRYTPSCSSASVWSQEVTIALTGPTQTPTPYPTAVPTPEPSYTPVPTYTPTPTDSPSDSISLSPTETPSFTQELNPDILGEIAEQNSDSATAPGGEPVAQATNSAYQSGTLPFIISGMCIGVGLALFAGAMSWQKTDLWKKHLMSHSRK